MSPRTHHRLGQVILTIATLAAGAGEALAQTEPAGKPLTLTIRAPRPVDDPRARQEQLLKRLEQSNYWVRSICVQCGDAWKHQIYAPFNPLDALGGRAGQDVAAD